MLIFRHLVSTLVDITEDPHDMALAAEQSELVILAWGSPLHKHHTHPHQHHEPASQRMVSIEAKILVSED